MRSRLLAILVAATATVSPALAQEQNSEIIQVDPDMFLRWHGHAGRTYFVQISDPNDHLRKWIWAPIIETGNDKEISYEVDGTADKGFFRLWFTDQPTADPDCGDFDGDGLSNLAEVQTHQTNPLKVDTDGDGMPDGWEVLYALNPLDAADGSLDPDNDGLTNSEEQDLGADPNDADSDDDGITDGGENDQGTDPNDPEDTPDAEWFILTGDLDQDEVKTRKRTVTIPAGQSRVIAVLVASDEYDYYTDPETANDFNDTLEWDIQPSQGDDLQGSIDVNARDTQWDEADAEGRTAQGFSPVHLETAMTATAPDDAALTVEIELSATNIGDGAKPSTVMVALLPVEVESMDKFLAGSFDESIIETFGGESSFGLEFRNPSSGESYRFNSIGDAYVYVNPYADTEEGEDAFLSDEEVAMGASGSDSEGRLSQDVIFYKQDGKLHFRTIFDQAGEIEIAILKDGQEIGAVTHELVEDEDIGDLIDTIDEVLSDEWGDGGPVILAAQSALFSPEGDEPQFAQARQGGRRGHYRHRNATTKVTMSIWDRIKNNFKEGVRRTTEAATRALRTAALIGKGFVEGAWMGIKDDAQGLVELVKMVANPTETAKSFYEAFKALMSLDLEGWKNVGLTMVESFLNKGKEDAGEWVQPDNFDVAAYLAGYTSGYIVEQAVITYVTAGGAQALKAGKIGGKIGALVRAAAKRIKPALAKTADNAMRVAALKAKNSIFRRVSQDVASDADVKKLKSILQELEFECPILAAP